MQVLIKLTERINKKDFYLSILVEILHLIVRKQFLSIEFTHSTQKMTDRIQTSPQATNSNQATIKHEDDPQLQPERSLLIRLFKTHRVSKICQKITLISLNQYLSNQRKSAYKNFVQNFSEYISFFCEIEALNKLRLDLLSSLALLSQQRKSISKQFISEVYDKIELYRVKNLEYVEAFFRLCKALSHNNNQTYETILKRSSRIFIKIHSTTLNSNILPYILNFSNTFDPMLIELKGKNQYINFKLQRKLVQDTQFRDRLATAHREIIKSINQDQIQMTSANKNQQPQINTVPIPKYNNDLTQVKSKTIFDQNNSMQLKSSIKFKIRENRAIAQSKDNKQSKQSSAQKIVQNFRKKSLQHRFTTSVDQANDEHNKLHRNTISTQNYHDIHKKSIQKNLRYMHAPKRLNFRAINLEPLENQSLTSSISSGNMLPVEALQNQKDDRESKPIFSLKRKHKRQSFQVSRTEKSVSEQFSDFDSPLRTQKSSKKPTSSSNKLNMVLSKRKYRKFESDQDFNSGISDDSSAQRSGTSESNMLRKQTKTKTKNEPLIDENIILQYRKRRISEAQEDSNKSLSRKATPQVAEVERELSKLKLKRRKEEEQTLGSTTNIESKGQEISEYICAQQMNKIGQSQNQKKQKDIQTQLASKQREQKPIQGPSEAQPYGSIPEKESSQSQNTSIQRIQQPKPQQNKIKRKIILKAAKVNFQQIPNYLEKLGFLNFDSMLRDISVHQHYICQFYLNQTIFNVIIFCPSLDFKNIQVKLIHQLQEVQSCLFESETVKERFRKVVLKNYIQIIQKSASLIFSSLVIKNPTPQQSWIKDCGFVPNKQEALQYSLKTLTKRQKTRQFLNIYGSIFSVSQQVNQSFLYSDQIATFKGGKYDINDKIFNDDEFSMIPSYTCKNLTSMKEINEILELKELDTFEVSPSVETLIFNPQQITQNQADLRTFTLQQILNTDFIIGNGWIKTRSQLIFNDKNQRIASMSLPGNYEIHFGKGFQHIGTMKNKITHYKTRMNSKKNVDFTSKIYPTKIRMFSKQLYGLIKHENRMAYYGNWEMNFHFKHQFLGRVVYSIDTSSNDDRLIFGNSTFFVTIYQGDQFIIGWEVEENDFLY